MQTPSTIPSLDGPTIGVHRGSVAPVTENDFAIDDSCILGKGTFSIVYRATHLASGLQVALKDIDKGVIRRMGVEESLASEINILRKVKHKHIVRLFSYYVTRESVVLVLELCSQGSLGDFLTRQKDHRCTERTAAKFIRDIALGLQFMHSQHLVHRDLKLDNVLIDQHGTAKLADFGTSRRIQEVKAELHHQMDECVRSPDADEIPSASRMTVCGTLDYLSPEMVQQQPHGAAVDVWALGAMTAELLTGHPPFYHDSRQDTARAIAHDEPDLGVNISLSPLRASPSQRRGTVGNLSPVLPMSSTRRSFHVGGSPSPRHCSAISAERHRGDQVRLENTLSPMARDFILGLLRKDATTRPSIGQVLGHPWLTQLDSH